MSYPCVSIAAGTVTGEHRARPDLLVELEELALGGHVGGVQVVAAHLVLVLQQHLAVASARAAVAYVPEVRPRPARAQRRAHECAVTGDCKGPDEACTQRSSLASG